MSGTDEASSEQGGGRHPVVVGLIALAGVGVVLGLVLGVVMIGAGHVFGVGGGSSNGVAAGASLYLPTPSPTQTLNAPLITLSTSPSTSPSSSPSQSGGGIVAQSPSQSPSVPVGSMELQVSSTTVSSTAQLKFSGVFPGGDGHIVRLQIQNPDGSWQSFGTPDMDVEGGVFSTTVQVSRSGIDSFRAIDIGTQNTSNVVSVSP